METGKTTVKGIFDASRIFNVPIYQRAYSWDKENHLPYFFNDLINQQPDRVYFFGTFLFHKNSTIGDFQVVDIIDGQQRMTTMVIFLSILVETLRKNGSNQVSDRTSRTFICDGDIFKLQLSNDDSSFLHRKILGAENPVDGEIDTESKRLLLEAKEYFGKKLKNLDQATLENIYTTLTTAEVLLYVVDQISSATQIFELLNDRGKKLTDLESIKSFLMYNMGIVTRHPDQHIKSIQDSFGAIYRLIEQHGLNDNDVLRYHTIAFENEFEERPKKFIKDKISALINEKKFDEAKLTIEKFTMSLRQSFELFRSIKDNLIKNRDLDRLFMIGRVAAYYPVMMYTLKNSPERFEELLRSLAKFTFKAGITNLRSSGDSYLHTELRHRGDIIWKISSFSNDNWWNINGRVKESLGYDNYYDWINKNIVKFILFSYENHCREIKGFPLLSLGDYQSTDPRKKLNIEHITAKKAKGMFFDDDFKERYLNSLGNLVIDSNSSNASKNNNHTSDKLEQFNKAPMMSQNKIDSNPINWSDLEEVKNFIDARTIVLRKFVISTILNEGNRYPMFIDAVSTIDQNRQSI